MNGQLIIVIIIREFSLDGKEGVQKGEEPRGEGEEPQGEGEEEDIEELYDMDNYDSEEEGKGRDP